jgi:murein DD-endopeptidase MepM/ murein hydrolase activator NlpD
VLAVLLCGWETDMGHGGEEPGRLLKVFTRDMGGITHFYVENLVAADVTTTFDLRLQNMKGSTNFPYTTIVAGNQSVEIFTLATIEKESPWDYSYFNSSIIGSTVAEHDDARVYLLPYAPGSSFRVSQGYHGSYSHTGPDDYAIDWKMPVGTPVHAARDGLVVKSKDDEDQHGSDRKFEKCANCILIQHSDGTIGIYAHLKKRGNKVKVGDRVKAGDLIGLSGNTGFTNGPHLHFSVFKAKDGREHMSLPVKFQSTDHGAITLVSGRSYTAGAVEGHQVKLPAPLVKATSENKRLGS